MKRILSIVISLAMLILMSISFALPLSAEGIVELAPAVTTASEDAPEVPKVTTASEVTTETDKPESEATEPIDDLMLATVGDVVASGTCGADGDGSNIKWELDREGLLTISGKGKMADYGIGTSVFDRNNEIKSVIVMPGVTSIGAYAFYFCESLASITIPDSVTSIGERAFYFCESLASISIPNSVTSIGNEAFHSCRGLTSLTIPNSVTIIGNSAFSWCSDLISIDVGAENPMYCSADGVLFSKDKAVLIRYPAGRMGSSYNIPNSVTSIDDSAFDFSHLTLVTIPKSVTSIGTRAFYASHNLTSIEVDTANPAYCSIDGVVFTKDKTKLICYPAGIENTSYIIPDGVLSIGNDAFCGYSSLTSITIPNSVTSICDRALEGCIGLTSIILSDSVTNIGKAAFRGCIGLTSVTMSNSVVSIGDYAFQNCNSLASVTIPSSVTGAGAGLFFGCSGLTNIYCEAESKPDGWSDYWWGIDESQKPEIHWGYDSNLDPSDSDVIATGYCGAEDDGLNAQWVLSCSGKLSVVGTGAMADYTAASTYSLRSAVETAPWAEYSARITSVEISEGITHIGSYSFYSCTSLKNAVIPTTMKSIGENAFKGCGALEEMTYEGDWNNVEVAQGNESLNIRNDDPVDDYLPGDINNDGEVDISDAIRLIRYLTDDTIEVNASALDINGDGEVDISDSIRLIRYLTDDSVEIY